MPTASASATGVTVAEIPDPLESLNPYDAEMVAVAIRSRCPDAGQSLSYNETVDLLKQKFGVGRSRAAGIIGKAYEIVHARVQAEFSSLGSRVVHGMERDVEEAKGAGEWRAAIEGRKALGRWAKLDPHPGPVPVSGVQALSNEALEAAIEAEVKRRAERLLDEMPAEELEARLEAKRGAR